jgi:hypothetical protein
MWVAHEVADHWIQTDYDAQHKGLTAEIAIERGLSPWAGRRACATHVATYTLTTSAFVGLSWLLMGLHIHVGWFVAGQLISAVTHYWADRRFTLAALCERLGKGNFYRLGMPREITAYTEIVTIDKEDYELEVHPTTNLGSPKGWDNPSLGTGAYVLDQTFHKFWLFVASLVTALI